MKLIVLLLLSIYTVSSHGETDLVDMINSEKVLIECDFDNGLCSDWQTQPPFQSTWKLGPGENPTHEPFHDHTIGESGEGKYLYFNVSYMVAPNQARFESEQFVWNPEQENFACVHFWYYIHGDNSAARLLLVKMFNRVPLHILKSLHATTQGVWLEQLVEVERIQDEEYFRLLFLGEKTLNSDGMVAIDDVTITQERCGAITCPPNKVLCEGTFDCISEEYICDGVVDCEMDGSDERDCQDKCVGILCGGVCISHAKICDGVIDCPDRADEDGCSNGTCAEEQFPCPESDGCLYLDDLCNGYMDCPGGEDERECPGTTDGPSPMIDNMVERSTAETPQEESFAPFAGEDETTTTATAPTTTTTTTEPTTTTTTTEPTTTTTTTEPTTTTTTTEPTTTTTTTEPTTTTTTTEPTTTTTTTEPTTTTTTTEPTTTTTTTEPTTTTTTTEPTTTTTEPTTTTTTTEVTTEPLPPTTKPTTAQETTAKPTTSGPTTSGPTTSGPTTTQPTTAGPESGATQLKMTSSCAIIITISVLMTFL